eukprot:TRINITY_DN38619_c0_g1_i1.p1 TRINITY_DN38619_c0_g1~~TRINITY_DN38619_c0_g1_i1.p1  ORF type:complete len:403 (+),score=49.98 TRINITY_DN38619_c0_g1_i1:112-1320(+)
MCSTMRLGCLHNTLTNLSSFKAYSSKSAAQHNVGQRVTRCSKSEIPLTLAFDSGLELERFTLRSPATQISPCHESDSTADSCRCEESSQRRLAGRREALGILSTLLVLAGGNSGQAAERNGNAVAAEMTLEAQDDLKNQIKAALRKVVSKPKAAGVLRLVFHDAGTFDLASASGDLLVWVTGGCSQGSNDGPGGVSCWQAGGMNGSVIAELERPESNGLKRPLRVLENVRTELETRGVPAAAVSWADLIAVAGAEAVAICGGPAIDVRLGRLDSKFADPEDRMPAENLAAPDLKQAFISKGFSVREMVALSGAHTLGSKGFGDPVKFDNSYFSTLLARPWIQPKDNMATMIGIASDRAIADDEECLAWIRLYASDQSAFFADFTRAYSKMIDLGARWDPRYV